VWWSLQYLLDDKTEKFMPKMQRSLGAIRWHVEVFVNDIGLKVKGMIKESRDVHVVRHIWIMMEYNVRVVELNLEEKEKVNDHF